MRSKSLHLLFFIPICCLVGCIGGDKNKFKVEGSIANMPVQTVVLEELGINDEITIIDSAKSDEHGKFQLSGTTPELSLYRLHFRNSRFILLAADNGTLRVSGTWPGIENYTVDGSAASSSLKKFITALRNHLRGFNTMGIIIDTLEKRGNDSILTVAKRDLQGMNSNFTHYVEVYADTTKYLPVALFAAGILNKGESPFLVSFTQNLDRRFPNAKLAKDYIASYNRIIAEQKKVQAQASSSVRPNVGSMAPDIKLTNTDGNELALSSLKGKYVLLDFWASWCGPCRAENPNVVAAYNKYKNKNFTIYSVSLDNKKDDWLKAISDDKLTWANHVSDLKRWESTPVKLYNIESIPTNFLLDPTGKIIARDLRGEQLDQSLSAVLK